MEISGKKFNYVNEGNNKKIDFKKNSIIREYPKVMSIMMGEKYKSELVKSGTTGFRVPENFASSGFTLGNLNENGS